MHIYIYGVFNFTKLKRFTIFFFLLKFAFAIFHFFHQIIALKLLWKMFFISSEKVLSYCKKYFLFHLKRSFCSWYIQISVFPLFSLSVNALIWLIIRTQYGLLFDIFRRNKDMTLKLCRLIEYKIFWKKIIKIL